jgi:hypothetical protein
MNLTHSSHVFKKYIPQKLHLLHCARIFLNSG